MGILQAVVKGNTQQKKERAQDMITYILVSHIWLATKENKWELKKKKNKNKKSTSHVWILVLITET